MFTDYRDITNKLGEPLWWTEEGFPRYSTFAPDQCGIYHDAAVLFEISCQNCSKFFNVSVTHSSNSLMNVYRSAANASIAVMELLKKNKETYTHDEVHKAVAWKKIPLERPKNGKGGFVHYGDPPNHGCIGDTMGSWNLRVLEYWEKGKDIDDYVNERGIVDTKKYKQDKGHNYMDWVRYPEYEIELEDMNSSLRTGT